MTTNDTMGGDGRVDDRGPQSMSTKTICWMIRDESGETYIDENCLWLHEEDAVEAAGLMGDPDHTYTAFAVAAAEPSRPVEADSDRTKLIDSVRYLRHRWMAATRHDGLDGDFDILLEVIDRLKRDAGLDKPTKPDASEDRAAFTDWYVKNAFDLEKQPVGCRECGLQWEAWQAALARTGATP